MRVPSGAISSQFGEIRALLALTPLVVGRQTGCFQGLPLKVGTDDHQVARMLTESEMSRFFNGLAVLREDLRRPSMALA